MAFPSEDFSLVIVQSFPVTCVIVQSFPLTCVVVQSFLLTCMIVRILQVRTLRPVIYLDWSDLERPDGSRFELDVEPVVLLVERTGFDAFGAPGAPDLYLIQ